jgi:hypothetical protein
MEALAAWRINANQAPQADYFHTVPTPKRATTSPVANRGHRPGGGRYSAGPYRTGRQTAATGDDAMSRNDRCVFASDKLQDAETVAAFLNSEGVPAKVIDPHALGGPDGLSLTPGTSRSLEVWVRDPAAAAYARRLIADHAADLPVRRADQPELIEVDCWECGAMVKFPSAVIGTVQVCPNCQADLDVPGPDDQWDDESAGDDDED